MIKHNIVLKLCDNKKTNLTKTIHASTSSIKYKQSNNYQLDCVKFYVSKSMTSLLFIRFIKRIISMCIYMIFFF